MNITVFEWERLQSLFKNTVPVNLTESICPARPEISLDRVYPASISHQLYRTFGLVSAKKKRVYSVGRCICYG